MLGTGRLVIGDVDVAVFAVVAFARNPVFRHDDGRRQAVTPSQTPVIIKSTSVSSTLVHITSIMESVDYPSSLLALEQSQNKTDMGPVPLSFPAILRNPKLSDRYAHLRPTAQDREATSQQQLKRTKKDRNVLEGKRWVRRRENGTLLRHFRVEIIQLFQLAKFTHNPHITPPTTAELALPSLRLPSSTFPTPLPPYLPRSVTVPPSVPPLSDPAASTAGLFSLSLRGTRRTLRSRPFTAPLIKAIESHLIEWLEGGTFLSPNEGASASTFAFPGEPVGGRADLREVRREAGRLVWAVRTDAEGDGGFERFIVHCVARWHSVVSFSKISSCFRDIVGDIASR